MVRKLSQWEGMVGAMNLQLIASVFESSGAKNECVTRNAEVGTERFPYPNRADPLVGLGVLPLSQIPAKPSSLQQKEVLDSETKLMVDRGIIEGNSAFG